MIGLILKDLYNLKKQTKTYLILLIFYYILGIANEDFTMVGSMVALLAAMAPITAMAYDERSKWDKYALTMPISRVNIVASKYLLSIIFLLIAFISTMLFSLLFSSLPLSEGVLVNLATLSTGVLIVSVVFPILFKFGVEKGRILMMVVLFSPTALIVLLSKLDFKMPIVDEELIKLLLYISPAISLAIFAISIMISVSIYNKKEF